MTQSLEESVDARSRAFDALAHEAPYLIEKLVKDRVVDSAEEGHALFLEVKRYLVLNQIDRTRIWKMYSLRVDEAWHQFILFTAEYVAFCQRYFGRYVHHRPSNAPDTGLPARAPEATFVEFGDRYREVFTIDLPSYWVDSSSVRPHRRILNDHAGHFRVHSTDSMVDLIGHDGIVLFSVRSWPARHCSSSPARARSTSGSYRATSPTTRRSG